MSRRAAIAWLTAALEMRSTGERPEDVLQAMVEVWMDEVEDLDHLSEDEIVNLAMAGMLWGLTSVTLDLLDVLRDIDPDRHPTQRRTLQILPKPMP